MSEPHTSPPTEILLVDDNAQVRRIVILMLEEEGYRVAPTELGMEALRMFSEDPRRFAVVLLDVALTDMPGQRLAEQLRLVRPDLPLIFITGHTAKELRDDLRHAHTHYLGKPFTPEQLYEAVETAIGRI